MTVIDELESLYFEMGELIDALSECDSVLDTEFYDMIIRDYRHDNLMLRSHLSKIKHQKKRNDGTLDNW